MQCSLDSGGTDGASQNFTADHGKSRYHVDVRIRSRNGSIDTTRPRFRARKGRRLVFGPAQSLLDVLLAELYFLVGCVCRLSAITREPCRSVKQLPGHRLQAAS